MLVQNEIERILCPYFKNMQITCMLKNDMDREPAWVVFEALKAMVLAKSPVVRGQPVFVAMDQPPWKRERNSLIAKAARIFAAVHAALPRSAAPGRPGASCELADCPPACPGCLAGGGDG